MLNFWKVENSFSQRFQWCRSAGFLTLKFKSRTVVEFSSSRHEKIFSCSIKNMFLHDGVLRKLN